MATPSTFSAPWSTSLKVTTAVVMLLLLGIASVGVIKTLPPLGFLMTITIPLLILGGTALFAVCGFELTHDELRVRRLLWNTRIPLAGLTDAFADPKAVDGSIRLFGVGGLFCYCGMFRNKRFGTYRMYATDLKKAVVLSIGGKTVILTPDEPERFVKAVKGE